MPPIPHNVSLSDEFNTTLAAVGRRRKDLEDYQIPRLRDCKGPLPLQQQFAAELKEDLEAFGRQVETLESLAEDQDRERERSAARVHVDEYAIVFATMKKDMRAALLGSKQAIDAQARSNREELLQSSVMREKQMNGTNEKPSDDALIDTSNKVTEALRRTTALMEAELKRSVLSTQLLESSTDNVRSTSSTHDTLSGLMNTSKQLITALEKADWMDRLIIFAALAFFLLVCLYIIKRRIVDRSMRIMFWWTRFLPDFGVEDQVLEQLEKGAASVVQSVVASSTVVAASAAAFSSSVSSVVASASAVVDEALFSLSADSSIGTSLPAAEALDEAISSLSEPTRPVGDEL